MTPDAVHDFWFGELTGEDRFSGKPEIDALIRERFGALHAAAAASELWSWRATPRGLLAEIIVLDQFSRQIHRGSALAFASDPLALSLAQQLVASGGDTTLSTDERLFAYLPFMHSESPVIQAESVRLYETLGNDNALEYAVKHRDVILRFGRYPKRNAALGRETTAEEAAYIEERGDAAF